MPLIRHYSYRTHRKQDLSDTWRKGNTGFRTCGIIRRNH